MIIIKMVRGEPRIIDSSSITVIDLTDSDEYRIRANSGYSVRILRSEIDKIYAAETARREREGFNAQVTAAIPKSSSK